jgi:hypothetical protein
MSDEDPIRLLEPGSAASDELRTLFRAGAEDLPTDAQLAALASKLGPVLDAPGPGAAAASHAGRTKALVAALGGVGLGVAAWMLLSPGPSSSPAPSSTVIQAPAPSIAPPSGGPSVEPQARPSAPPAAPAPNPEVTPSVARPAAAPPARPAESEAEFLERARGALGQSPSLALSLANQHRARYPSGVLAEEREVIAIEALKRLGRTAESERRIEAFSRRYPGSAYRKKLDSGAGK